VPVRAMQKPNTRYYYSRGHPGPTLAADRPAIMAMSIRPFWRCRNFATLIDAAKVKGQISWCMYEHAVFSGPHRLFQPGRRQELNRVYRDERTALSPRESPTPHYQVIEKAITFWPAPVATANESLRPYVYQNRHRQQKCTDAMERMALALWYRSYRRGSEFAQIPSDRCIARSTAITRGNLR